MSNNHSAMMAKKEMRTEFCQTLISLAEKHQDVVLLDADLMGAMGTKKFKEKFPDRAIDCGIQEANMVGVGCGMSIVGLVPFIHSFAPFISRRALDQIFVSGAYNQANIKLIGSDPGITAERNGGTHMPFEDMGIMRSIPNATVLEPSDITMMEAVVKQIYKTYGLHYMRLVRKNCVPIYNESETFEIGKAKQVIDGSDTTIIASGYCVSEALVAQQTLKKLGIRARVLDMFTWKPIDKLAIIAAAKETGAIVTCENHNYNTGLGSAVSEVVVGTIPVPMEIIGIKDQFGQVGSAKELARAYEIDASAIVKAVIKVIKRREGTKS